MTDKRKPLAALIVSEKSPPEEESNGGDEEQMLAEDAAAAMGAKDPQAAGAALVDVIRACMAKQRKGSYSE